jgi:DNA-binding transcriptional MerR regulator
MIRCMIPHMPEVLTIDELAQRAGMTVRNVRAHQTRGLLPPPQLRGRTGYYGAEHLARLRLIKDMQTAGFNLNAIKKLLDAAPHGSGEEILQFERALMAPWGTEEPQILDPRELFELAGQPPPEVVERAIGLGVVDPLPDGRYEVKMPSVLQASRELESLGVPFDRRLDVVEALLHHAEGIADEFVQLFIEEVWRPFESRGRPPEELPRVRAGLERLRPLASDVLLAAFQTTMKGAIEKAFGRELERYEAAEEAG